MKTKRLTTKKLCLLIAVLLLSVATVGGTLAYIFTQTTAVVNTFIPSEVTCAVNEPGWVDGESTTKNNVSIINTGDVSAFVRAAIVITWQDEEGNIFADQPVRDKDYTINLNVGSDAPWVAGKDGYYYHKTPVASEGDKIDTEILINSCEVIGKAPSSDYTLHVEVIADAIQAEPADAVKEAWGVTIFEGSVTPVTQ